MPEVGPVHSPLRMARRAATPVSGKAKGLRCVAGVGMAAPRLIRPFDRAYHASSAFAAFCCMPGLLAALKIGGSLPPKDADGGRGAQFVGGIRRFFAGRTARLAVGQKFNRAAAGQRWRASFESREGTPWLTTFGTTISGIAARPRVAAS